MFGESFPFGEVAGDVVTRPVFNSGIPFFLPFNNRFTLFGRPHNFAVVR